jgi:ElaB/YqjD/DUF883 family membrane-anchored ribosome-binding protein
MSRNNQKKIRRSQTQKSQGGARGPQPSNAQYATSTQATQTRGLHDVQQRIGSELESTRKALTQTLSKTGESAMQAIKDNPVPLALAGVGVACAGASLAWFLGSASRNNGSSASSSAANAKVSELGRSAAQLSRSAAQQGRKLKHTAEETVHEHPLATGAALFAAGTALGLAIPRTAFEDTWLGRERDQIVSKAQQVARGAVQKVESIAKEVMGATNAQA